MIVNAFRASGICSELRKVGDNGISCFASVKPFHAIQAMQIILRDCGHKGGDYEIRTDDLPPRNSLQDVDTECCEFVQELETTLRHLLKVLKRKLQALLEIWTCNNIKSNKELELSQQH